MGRAGSGWGRAAGRTCEGQSGEGREGDILPLVYGEEEEEEEEEVGDMI